MEMEVQYVILVVCVVTLLLLVGIVITMLVVWRKIRRRRKIIRSRGVSLCQNTVRKKDGQLTEVYVKRLSRQATGNSAGEPGDILSIGNAMDPQPQVIGGAPLVLIVPDPPPPVEIHA